MRELPRPSPPKSPRLSRELSCSSSPLPLEIDVRVGIAPEMVVPVRLVSNRGSVVLELLEKRLAGSRA